MDERPSVLYICHHGTKDMKWGVRRYQNKDGSLTPAGRARYGKGGPRKTPVTKSGKPVVTSKKGEESELDKESKPRKKPLDEMSDDELSAVINRLTLEQHYKEVLAESKVKPKKNEAARKLISEIVKDSAKNIGTQAVTYAMGAAVNKVCRGVFGIHYDVVNPTKGQGARTDH